MHDAVTPVPYARSGKPTCVRTSNCPTPAVVPFLFTTRLYATSNDGQPEPGAVLAPERHAAELRRVLAGYKVPRTFTFADTLPRDDNGKIAKRRLRETYAAT